MKLRNIGCLLALVALVGCKVELSATTGGSIQTTSGSFSCSGGESCTHVDVSDLAFDETFMAVADEGFRFVSWRRRNRGLCGGSTDSCRLFTAGFAGSDQLLAILDSDEVFFLEAVFEPQAGGGSGGGSSASCWNSEMFTAGTQMESEYRVTETLGNQVVMSYQGIIEGGLTFNGNAASAIVLDIVSTGAVENTALSRSYFQIPSARRVRDFGTEVELTSPQMASAVTINEPFRLVRFDLNAGESDTQTYTTTTTTDTGDGPNSDTVTTTLVRRFDGIESVTVPAGTFQACRFTETATTSGFEDVQREWVDVGSGVLLKAENDAQTTELVRSLVNGTVLSP
ncbi:MAG: hypothetical protein AAF194_06300 [Pseudomonadota bacterium]